MLEPGEEVTELLEMREAGRLGRWLGMREAYGMGDCAIAFTTFTYIYPACFLHRFTLLYSYP